MAKKKFYAIKGDLNSAIFTTWAETEKEMKRVDHYGKRVQKGFVTREEAEAFLGAIDPDGIYIEALKEKDTLFAYTDGTWNSDTEKAGYGLVFVYNREIIDEFSGVAHPKYNDHNQISGECKAAMMAIHAIQTGKFKTDQLVIVHDLEHIDGWANGWNTNNELTTTYAQFMKDKVQEIKSVNPNFKLEFVKVPSHSNISFNERADVIADLATK